jgi:hypothetical protein
VHYALRGGTNIRKAQFSEILLTVFVNLTWSLLKKRILMRSTQRRTSETIMKWRAPYQCFVLVLVPTRSFKAVCSETTRFLDFVLPRRQKFLSSKPTVSIGRDPLLVVYCIMIVPETRPYKDSLTSER